MVAADRALLQTIAALSAAWRELNVPAMLIGGIAVIARGIPRQTVDVDATLWAEDEIVQRAFGTPGKQS